MLGTVVMIVTITGVVSNETGRLEVTGAVNFDVGNDVVGIGLVETLWVDETNAVEEINFVVFVGTNNQTFSDWI